MPISARFPDGRSQDFTFLRRKLSKKAVLLTLLPPIPRALPQHSKCPFRIGDQVSERWIDEYHKDRIYYGEVCGTCWHPRERAWYCLINWTGGDDLDVHYPCFDEQLVPVRDLRRVGHA